MKQLQRKNIVIDMDNRTIEIQGVVNQFFQVGFRHIFTKKLFGYFKRDFLKRKLVNGFEK